VLGEVLDDVVVIGAAALEVALAGESSVVITPTRDVDVVVPVERAADIVSHLEAKDMRRSEIAHARAFTWRAPEIASELFVSPNTIRPHLRHMYAKLGVHNRAEAVVRARGSGSSHRPVAAVDPL
jgi:DNA-binding NarL/FixJ family response regulator